METNQKQNKGKHPIYTDLSLTIPSDIRLRQRISNITLPLFPVRDPQGKIRLYCKGADTLLLERLHPCNQELMTVTSDHLNVRFMTLTMLRSETTV